MSKDQTFSVAIPGHGRIITGTWRWPTSDQFETAAKGFNFARQTASDLVAYADQVRGDSRLSETGIREQVHIKAGDAHRAAGRFRASLKDQRTKTQERRRALVGVKPRDPGDVAGQMADMELRNFFATLEGEKREKYIARTMTGELPELANAILRAPAYLSEILSYSYEKLRETATPRENREKCDELDSQVEAIDAALKAIDIAERKVAEIADLDFQSRTASEKAGAVEANAEIDAETEEAEEAVSKAELAAMQEKINASGTVLTPVRATA